MSLFVLFLQFLHAGDELRRVSEDGGLKAFYFPSAVIDLYDKDRCCP